MPASKKSVPTLAPEMTDYDLTIWFPIGPGVTVAFRSEVPAKVTSNAKERYWVIAAAGQPETTDLIIGWQELVDNGWGWAFDEITAWGAGLRQKAAGEEREPKPADADRPDGDGEGGQHEADDGDDKQNGLDGQHS